MKLNFKVIASLMLMLFAASAMTVSASDNGSVQKVSEQYGSRSGKGGLQGMLNGNSGSSSSSRSRGSNYGYTNGHEWVDLGLPSGIRWATCNVGASSPEDYGNYYAWGETRTKSRYSSGNSDYYERTLRSFAGDSRYDAATANWGSQWRTPTYRQIKEMLDNCDHEWVRVNGVYGMRMTSRINGASFFIPANGNRVTNEVQGTGEYGDYWSSDPNDSDTTDACSFFLSESGINPFTGLASRYCGYGIRAVTGF